MKVLLAAINAKYIHTSLAVRSLSCYAEHTLAQRSGAAGKPKKPDIAFAEYTLSFAVMVTALIGFGSMKKSLVTVPL